MGKMRKIVLIPTVLEPGTLVKLDEEDEPFYQVKKTTAKYGNICEKCCFWSDDYGPICHGIFEYLCHNSVIGKNYHVYFAEVDNQ